MSFELTVDQPKELFFECALRKLGPKSDMIWVLNIDG